MSSDKTLPKNAVIGVVGWSGAGKTTLIEGVIARLAADGLSVATIKHAHKRFDMDREGKDSWRHRAAGARQTLVTSPDRWALLTEHAGEAPPSLDEALALLAPADIVLVEGYRGGDLPKIEVWRPGHGGPPIWPDDDRVIAVASTVDPQAPPAPLNGRPLLPLDAPAAVVAYLLDETGALPRPTGTD